jgi:hypothetical protein
MGFIVVPFRCARLSFQSGPFARSNAWWPPEAPITDLSNPIYQILEWNADLKGLDESSPYLPPLVNGCVIFILFFGIYIKKTFVLISKKLYNEVR